MDADGLDKINNYALRTKRALDAGKFFQATDLWYQTEVVLLQYNKGVDFYNVLYDTDFRSSDTKAKYLLLSPRTVAFDMMVKRKRLNAVDESDDDEPDKLTALMRGPVHLALALPSNVVWGSQSGAVFDTLAGDFMKPVVAMVEEVLNNTTVKVVVYSGQLDLICATPGTVQWVNNMKWAGGDEYAKSPRDGIGINNILEGYHRGHGNFSMYWVRTVKQSNKRTATRMFF